MAPTRNDELSPAPSVLKASVHTSAAVSRHMPHPDILTITACLSVLTLAFAVWSWTVRKTRLPYPPGPKQMFLVGNLFDMPRSRQCLKYFEWSRQYGPIIYLNVAGQSIIVLNNYQVTKDLLDKRGHIYSDRPQLQMAGELIGFSNNTTFARYGHEWRNQRKLLNKALNPGTVQPNYSALQEWKTRAFLYSLLQYPDRVIDGLNQMVGEAVTEIAYGVNHIDEVDLVSMGEELSKIVGGTITGYLVDLLPILKMVPAWFPGAKFKRDAKAWRQKYFSTRDFIFNGVRSKLANNDELPASYVSRALNDIGENDDREAEENAIKASSLSFYRAGTDSTTATIKFFILAMVLHPDIQTKAQAEIDRVVKDRLPGIVDLTELPYVTAVALESMRWGVHGTLALPHRLMEDDHYKGYLLPAGSTVFANVWAISRDPLIYPNPDQFDPERFYSRKEMDPREIVFGFGRRICPGSHLAMQAFLIAAMSFLWSYRARSRQDLATIDRDIYKLFNFSTLHHPLPFDCDIEPRSALTKQHLREALSSGRPN